MLAQLQARGVGDQSGGNVRHPFDDLQAVGFQSRAGLDDIHDTVSQSDQRRQFYGAFDLDDAHVHVLVVKEGARDVGVFGGDGLGVVTAVKIKVFFGGEGEFAPAESEVEQFIKGAAVLEDGVLADYAEIADALSCGGETDREKVETLIAKIDALKEHDVAVMLCSNTLTLACGKLTSEHNEIMKEIEPAMATYPPGSRIGRVIQIGHALPRTADGDIERWKLQKELDDGNC